MNCPNPLNGTDPASIWLNRLRSYCRSLEIIKFPKGLVSRGVNGTKIETEGDSGGGISIIPYYVVEHFGDYLNCRSWDGTNAGSTDITIAKPYELRFSLTGETLDGVAFTYGSYVVASQSRIATFSSGTTESQFITPRYRVGTILFAAKAQTGVDTATLIDLNVGARAWAAP
jgi:hypothetical protein